MHYIKVGKVLRAVEQTRPVEDHRDRCYVLRASDDEMEVVAATHAVRGRGEGPTDAQGVLNSTRGDENTNESPRVSTSTASKSAS
jgi:hypothetical protein